jgi:hypothetical protein
MSDPKFYPHPDSATVAIIAHAKAQQSIDDFRPKWEALPARLIFSIPEGEYLQGVGITVHLGMNAYSGLEVFRRFTLTLEAALRTAAETIVIAEYDTVPLRPVLPYVEPGYVSSFFTLAPALSDSSKVQVCALSPWSMDHRTGDRLLDACKESLETDPDHPEGNGLLDRWLGTLILRHQIPSIVGPDLLGYPWHEGVNDRIRHMGYNWIHGWKRKEEFGDLWT